MAQHDPHEGHAGRPGKTGSGGAGGAGGVGGQGGDPGGIGGQGGPGGNVYVDSRYVQRWVRNVRTGYVALALAMIVGFWLGAQERDARIKDNARAVAVNVARIKENQRQHSLDDQAQDAAAIRADCERTRLFVRIAHRNGYYNTPQGRRDLDYLVRHGSRAGCSLR